MLRLWVPKYYGYGEHREESLRRFNKVCCVSRCPNVKGMASTGRNRLVEAMRCVVFLGA